MWPLCLEASPLWSAVPVLIGLIAGWWTWGGRVPAREPVVIEPKAPSDPVPVLPQRHAAAPHLWVVDLETPVLTAIGIPAAVGLPDDLTQLKGIGPKLGVLLADLGVTRFDQIARWGDAEIALVDCHLGAFRGRIVRDRWVEQARLLARGATEEFAAKFGRFEGDEK